MTEQLAALRADHAADLQSLARLPVGDPARTELRDRVVEAHLPLVRYLAARFRGLGEPLDDLVQVGTIGLINAVDRFDPTRGVALASYATPTILGEIKRHFRDRAWAVRVPRRLQELQSSISSATSALTQQLGRSPTLAELSHHLEEDEETLLEALEAQRAYATVPLDAPLEESAPSNALMVEDAALDDVVDRESLRPLLQRLPAREKRILMLRFFRGLSQSEIAEEMGISQMHVSRLLARTVKDLRRGLADAH